MAKKKIEVKTPQFNPQGTYQWQTDDKFIFTGAELDTLNKSLGKFLSGSIDVPNILGLVVAANIIQGKIAQYVEEGTIREFIPEAEVIN